MTARHFSLVSLLLSAAAFAQAPSNDLCVGAEVLTFNAGLATSSIIRNQILATDAGEASFSCASTTPNIAGKTVWFTFTAPATGSYGFDTCGSATAATALAVYTGDCTTLTQVPGACVNLNSAGSSCSAGARMTTSTLDAGAGLPIGINLIAGTTYYVQVGVITNSVYPLTDWGQMRLRVGTDTSPPANDTCFGTLPSLPLNTPTLVANRGASMSLAADNTQLAADAGLCFQTGGTAETITNAPGQEVVLRFTPPADGLYSIRAVQPVIAANPVLYLTTSACFSGAPGMVAGTQCIAAANRGPTSGLNTGEELSCVQLQSGIDYNLYVDMLSAFGTGTVFNVEAAACYPEAEPNDQPTRASQLRCPMTGNYFPAGDNDFYELGRYPGARLFAMTEMNATGFADSQLRVTTDTDTLFFDEDDGTGLMGTQASVVAGVVLPDAPAYVETNYKGVTTVAGPYRLHTMLKFGAPTPEREPNDTRAQAVDLGGFITGTLDGGAEIDMYKFDARQGDLVFVALDTAPGRSGTATGDLNFEVFDALGWSVGLANDNNTATVNTAAPGTLAGTTPTAPAEGIAFRASTTGPHYVHVTRLGATGSDTYHLAISVNCGMVQPTLSAVAPATGTILGGDTLTLTGTGFDDSSQVFINGVRATVTSFTATSITVTTPGGNAGAVDVVVTNFGKLSSTLPNGFTYVAPVYPPTVSSVTPAFGAMTGGSVITVSGTLFKPGAEVSFTVGGVTALATAVNVVNATQLTCLTPAMPAGLATVTVRNVVDDLSGSLADAYAFVPPPTITGVTPNVSLVSGGGTITVTGTGFFAGATVRFGSTLGSSVVVASDGLSLTVTVPSAPIAGAVTLTVRNIDGQQATSGFTYVYPAPTIATISPAFGVAPGGQVITITGTGFLGAPAPTVLFGSTPAPTVARLSATQLSVLTPAGSGVVDLTLTNNDGQSVLRTQAFTYMTGPTVSSVTPVRGPALGGTRVTISGQNFVAGARVTIGGVPALAPLVVDANTISVVTNAGPLGPADLVVQNPDLQSAMLPAAFTFDPSPVLSSLTPGSGTQAGGTIVTLSGSGFRAGATVFFGSLAAANVNVVSPTEIQANTPASPLGVVQVRVTNDDGQTTTLARAFRFVAPPTIVAVDPATGDVSGGTVVRVTGTNFGAATQVSFGGVPARVSFVSSTALDAVTPAHGPGAVEVLVINGNGDTASLADGFQYTRAAPTLVSLVPASGLTTGGAQVNVTGTGFAPNATVTFGGVAATSVVVASPELLRVIAPAHAAGAVEVVVTNDDGQSAALPSGFSYVAPVEGNAGFVTDGGDGSLTGEAQHTEPPPTGCGCSSLEGSVLAFSALGLLLRRRRFGAGVR